MKNILIMGIGRAGKSTLSNMIKEKYPKYNLVRSDSIKWGILGGDGKESYYRKNIKEQKEFEHGAYFQRVVLEFFRFCVKYDICNCGYMLESGQLEPKYVKEMVDFDKTLVICLGHGTLTKTDIINLCRTYDKEKDWTYGMSDKDLEVHAEKWSKMNEELKIECPKYGIEYIDTSKDREKVLKRIVDRIGKEALEE